MSERYVTGSPQWLSALHALFTAARAGLVLDEDFSLCEVYRNAPPEVAVSGAVAFTVTLRKDSDKVEFVLAEADNPSLKVVGDYDEVLPLSRYRVNGDPERKQEYAAMVAGVVSRGRATFSGGAPAWVEELPVHDQIAMLTA